MSVREKSAEMLDGADLATLGQDAAAFIRKHPTEALAAGFAVGFLLARAVRS